MAKWTTTDFETPRDFLSAWRLTPELVVVRGLMHGRFGPQSLSTVLDEFPQVYVENPLVGWNILFVCNWSRRQNHYVVAKVIPHPLTQITRGQSASPAKPAEGKLHSTARR